MKHQLVLLFVLLASFCVAGACSEGKLSGSWQRSEAGKEGVATRQTIRDTPTTLRPIASVNVEAIELRVVT